MTLETDKYVSIFPESELSELAILIATKLRYIIAAMLGRFKGNDVHVYIYIYIY